MKNHRTNEPSKDSRVAVALTLALLAVVSLTVAVAVVAETPEGPEAGQVAVGKTFYRGYCTSCHGAEARGDGPIAEYLTVSPADLTQLVEKYGEFPFERVVKTIDGRVKVKGHGTVDMPIWGEVFQKAEGGGDEEAATKKITALAHYIWSIQADADSGR